MARRVAVVGAGMTKFVRRAQETGKELAWIGRARGARVVRAPARPTSTPCALTSAPDAFDGVHRKGEYLADGAGASGKPYMRTYVGGGSGVFTAIQAWYTVASGMADVVLVRGRGEDVLDASRTRRARSSRSSTTSSNARSGRTCCGSSRSR